MNNKHSNFILLAAITLTTVLTLSADAQDIPTGVRYKKTTDEINQKAKRILDNTLAKNVDETNIETFSASAIVCGPLLWDALKNSSNDILRGGKTMIHMIPAPTPIRKEGKGFITSDQIRAFWKLFMERIKANNTFKVRQAETAEISYFWATIPFDIEEPLQIIDFGKIKVLVNFSMKNGEPKIFWMDIVGDLKALQVER